MSGTMQLVPMAKKINHQFQRQWSQVGKKKLVTFFFLISFDGSAADSKDTEKNTCLYSAVAKISCKDKCQEQGLELVIKGKEHQIALWQTWDSQTRSVQ